MTEARHQRPQKQHHNRKRKNNHKADRSRRRKGAAADSSVPAATKPVCSVCTTVEAPKYKCPKCRCTYCSIQCCRDHKAKGCITATSTDNATATEESKETTTTTAQAPTSLYLPKEELSTKPVAIRRDQNRQDEEDDNDSDLEEGWKMTTEMMEAMQQSEWLQNELKDLGLQQIIAGIDNASSNAMRRNQTKTRQEMELNQAKRSNPRFQAFLDKLLVLTGVLERPVSAANNINNAIVDPQRQQQSSLEDWLKSADVSSQELTLAPVAGQEPRRVIKPEGDRKKSDDDGTASGDGSSSSDDDSSDED